MDKNTTAKLKEMASQLIKGEAPSPCPIVGQRAIAILKVMADGKWHTTTQIAQQLGIGKKYVSDILRAVQHECGLISQKGGKEGGRGWKLLSADDCNRTTTLRNKTNESHEVGKLQRSENR